MRKVKKQERKKYKLWTEKQRKIFYKALEDVPSKEKKVKRISHESGTSLSYTYKCLEKLKRYGYALQTTKRPKAFIRVGRLPEENRR